MTTIRKLNNSTGKRLFISLAIGIIAIIIMKLLDVGNIAFLVGWTIASIVFVVWVLLIIWPMDHKRTAEYALREDPSRTGADIVLLIASVASLGAVGYALFQAGHSPAGHQLLLTSISIASVVISWVLIHTIYTLRYAYLYYSKTIVGRVDFKHDHEPEYSDFIYLAFTVGMTYQVADTDLIGSDFRKAVLKHSLLSYLFGVVIIATTISLIAGLGH
jgi:uncharacterized membrane protein